MASTATTAAARSAGTQGAREASPWLPSASSAAPLTWMMPRARSTPGSTLSAEAAILPASANANRRLSPRLKRWCRCAASCCALAWSSTSPDSPSAWSWNPGMSSPSCCTNAAALGAPDPAPSSSLAMTNSPADVQPASPSASPSCCSCCLIARASGMSGPGWLIWMAGCISEGTSWCVGIRKKLFTCRSLKRARNSASRRLPEMYMPSTPNCMHSCHPIRQASCSIAS
mmetsp:Transcript_1676/g.4097  ORF Transcript_1676/g.4097 Transcript_1676/m.4097 type:complete len:229 (-) Transcript_1676:368-1054(-)